MLSCLEMLHRVEMRDLWTAVMHDSAPRLESAIAVELGMMWNEDFESVAVAFIHSAMKYLSYHLTADLNNSCLQDIV